MTGRAHVGLTPREVQTFIDDGFVKLENAFSPEMAKQCRDQLWTEIGLSPHHPQTWTQPIIRVASNSSRPFVEAANSSALTTAYDQLAGEGRWLAPQGLGTFPIRFPHPQSPGDDGWHIDASFGLESPHFMDWRVNIKSSGRALLMLFLLSDVGNDDAPTRVRVGSHKTIARQLLPYGPCGATLRQISMDGFASTADCPVALATGSAGDVYLCHPFLVHAAQPHRGKEPRFLAQPPLIPKGDFDPELPPSPVQIAIRIACGLAF